MKRSKINNLGKIATVLLLTAVAAGCTMDTEIPQTEPADQKIAFSVTAGEDASAATRSPGTTQGVVVTAAGVFAAATGLPYDMKTGKAADPATTQTRGFSVQEETIPIGSSLGVLTYQLPSRDGGITPGTMAYSNPYYALPSNTKVTRTAQNVYSYGTPVAWPAAKNDLLKFFAYYPYRATWANDEDPGISYSGVSTVYNKLEMWLNYRMDTDPTKHIDLMYAASKDLYHTPSVPLALQHALTRLTFEARLDDPFYDTRPTKVTRVSVRNIYPMGSLGVYPTADSNIPEADWVVANEKFITPEYPITIQATSVATGLDDLPLSRTGYNSLLSFSDDSHADMLVIPQDLKNIELEIELTIDDPVKGEYTELRTIPLAGSRAWTMGGYLNYRILITPLTTELDEVQVLPWNDNSVGVKADAQHRLTISRPRIWVGNEGIDPTYEPKGKLLMTIIESNNLEAGVQLAGPFKAGTTDKSEWLTGYAFQTWPSEATEGYLQYRIIVFPRIGIYTGTEDRDAYFLIKSGELEYEFHVIQSAKPWLNPVIDNCYPMDGDLHSFTIRSETDWTVEGSQRVGGSDDPVTALYTQSGKWTDDVWFRTYDDFDVAAKKSDLAVFLVKDVEGLCPPQTVTVDCVTGLVVDQLANSYMLAPSDNVETGIYIPVGRANEAIPGSIGGADKLKAEVVWTDNTRGVMASSSVRFFAVSGRGNNGYLFVQQGSDPVQSPGNAVVAVKTEKDDSIRWSWHVWVTDYAPGTEAMPTADGANAVNGGNVYRYTSNTGEENVFMDRNLGALSTTWANWSDPGTGYNPSVYTDPANTVMGLHYQFGRKDPLSPSSNVTVPKDTGTTLAKSVAAPGTFLTDWVNPMGTGAWYSGDADAPKTIYDPCPPGWRIPVGAYVLGNATGVSLNGAAFGDFSAHVNGVRTLQGAVYAATGARGAEGVYDFLNYGRDYGAGYWWKVKVGSASQSFLGVGYSTFAPDGGSSSKVALSVRCVAETMQEEEELFKVSVGESPGGIVVDNIGANGQAARTTGVPEGTPVIYGAQANSGYVFHSWEASGITLTDEQAALLILNFTMPASDMVLTPKFVPATVRIGELTWSQLNVKTAGSAFALSATTPGGLFNWSAAQTACPTGWRLPTSAELTDLLSRRNGTEYVNNLHVIQTSDGELLLPKQGTETDYWSSSEVNSTAAYGLYFNSGNAGSASVSFYVMKDTQALVRCVRDGILVGGVYWAEANVEETADVPYGMLFQWDKNTPSYTTGADGNIPAGWDGVTYSQATTWQETTNPCPTGWNVPTEANFLALLQEDHTWGARDGVNGLVFDNGLFLPAAGSRGNFTGVAHSEGKDGFYWTSEQGNSSTMAKHLTFSDSASDSIYSVQKTCAMSVRCVRSR